MSTNTFKKIGNYESVIYINTNDKGKFWSSSLFSLSYAFTIIIVLFLSWKAERCPSFQIRFSLRTWEQIVRNTASALPSNVFLTLSLKMYFIPSLLPSLCNVGVPRTHWGVYTEHFYSDWGVYTEHFYSDWGVYTEHFHSDWGVYTEHFYSDWGVYTKHFHSDWGVYTEHFYSKWGVYTEHFHSDLGVYTEHFHSDLGVYTEHFHSDWGVYTEHFHLDWGVYMEHFHSDWTFKPITMLQVNAP